ncbi:APC family permease [Terriglobus roseus]|uniref:Amino acid/polyamine/organocation transporter, APC superfamily n=1 Tax=Terriglobus roseus TaxID=392734 RepID=A0A1H4JA96_9BACT|nr:APC family permease [Terriglobus roseus]SEB43234.1 amino acid/polyamine/organocation transporter, APC superfamily [Terriglobus roseus]
MTQTAAPSEQLERSLKLPGAIAANVLNMVGVGPFLTIPLALAAMGGPQAMLGWVLGALLALCDGMVWAELGSRFPRSGGPYHYLLQAFGPHSYGRMIAFLFLWQSLLIGPISIASGAVGFAEYAGVLHPMTSLQAKLLAMALCLVNMAVLYRPIRSVAAMSVVVMSAVLATCVWIVVSGALHFNASIAFSFPEGAFHLNRAFWTGLGSATLIATYDYGGYNNVCLLGGEIQSPRRNIPRAVLVSIVAIAMLYLAMNLSIIGTLPWQSAQHSSAVVADFMRAIHGTWAARTVTVLILLASWGSAYAILLGYSRVPYTAAVDGTFPHFFAKVHARGHFPTTSLIFMGVASAILCSVSLAELIAALIVVQTLLQFMAQCVAVILLRRNKRGESEESFRMPLYPLPVVVALAGWAYIVTTGQPRHIAIAIALGAAGVAAFLLRARSQQEWPFQTS